MSLSDESAANATNGKHPPTPFNIDGLLGMQCEYGSDGSITIHQRAYAEKLVERFLPNGPVGRASANPLPFSDNLPRLVIEALDGSTAAEPAYPEPVSYTHLTLPTTPYV